MKPKRILTANADKKKYSLNWAELEILEAFQTIFNGLTVQCIFMED